MPRYRKYTRTIVKKPRQRYNRTFEIFGPSSAYTINGQTAVCIYGSAVYNAKDNEGYSTATTIQATRIRAMGQINIAGNATESGPPTPCFVKAYITFVPQIVYEQAPDTSSASYSTVYNYWKQLVEAHPEYIMGQKTINTRFQGGFPGEKVSQNFTVTSGIMKRNLKSGDRILTLIFAKSLSIAFNAAIQVYWEAEASVRNN